MLYLCNKYLAFCESIHVELTDVPLKLPLDLYLSRGCASSLENQNENRQRYRRNIAFQNLSTTSEVCEGFNGTFCIKTMASRQNRGA